MDKSLIKKFCKSNKNGILSKNKPEGLLNYISFYKDIDSDELKPHVITFKKSLNKKNRYNLCKDNSCKEDEYVVKNLKTKKIKKLLKNIDDFKLAKIRKELNLENRISSKIKYVKQTKKQKAKNFKQCKELLKEKKSLVSKLRSKRLYRKKETSKKSAKINFDFLKKLIPKRENKKEQVIIREVIQQKQPTPKKPEIETNEIKELKREKEKLKKELQNVQIVQQPNTNNSEKQKYLEKIKSLESKLEEVASYGEKKSASEKELKQKIDITQHEYEKELQRQKSKLYEETQKRRKLEYNKQYAKSKQGSYNSQLSQYKRELQARKAEEARLRSERNQYRSRADLAQRQAQRQPQTHLLPSNQPKPKAKANAINKANNESNNGQNNGENNEENNGANNSANNSANNAANNAAKSKSKNKAKNKAEELLIGAFDIFVVDFKTINNNDVNAVKSHIELLKQNNPEKKVYLFNVPETLINEESMKDNFFSDGPDTDNNKDLQRRLANLKDKGKPENKIINYSSSANYSKENIKYLLDIIEIDNGKRTLLICSNEHNELTSIFHKKPEYKNIDILLIKNNIVDLFTIEKNTLRGNVNSDFKHDTNDYTYYDNDNSYLKYN